MKLQQLLKGRSPESSTVPAHGRQLARSAVEKDYEGQKSNREVGGALRGNQPTEYDVLFGRGKPYQGHAGNIRLHKVVDLYKVRYSQARRHEKTEIAEEIVQFIRTAGNSYQKAGRFLKRAEGEEKWVEVGDNIARDKVSHALRGKTRKQEGSSLGENQAVKAELTAGKRPMPSKRSSLQVKRQKMAQPAPSSSELELLTAHRNMAMTTPLLSASTSMLSAVAAAGNLPMELQSRLLASILAERHLGLGNPLMMSTQFGGAGLSSGLAGQWHSLPSHLLANEPLINLLRSERNSLMSDPRLWF